MARPLRDHAAGPTTSLPRGVRHRYGQRAWSALAAILVATVATAASPRPSGPESLVPANIQPQTDDKGNQWNLNNYGFLQNPGNGFFNNILMLHVGGQQFHNYQPMMTADGKEFVLPGQQPVMGLQITRRIRLLEKDGLMRYVDLFQNPGATPVNTTVEYRNNFSSPIKATLTDRGTANPTALAKGESGLLVTSKQNGQKACFFVIVAPGARLRPNITLRGQYEAHFSFALNVPPGQTVALTYVVGTPAPPPDGDRAAVAKLFREVSPARFLKTLRREDLRLLANFAAAAGGEPSALLEVRGLGSLDVERSSSDVLAMGDKTRLTGTTSSSGLTVTTALGATPVAFDQVAALAGGVRAGGGTRVFLRDGQILDGRVEAGDFRFEMPGGAQVDLDVETLDRLVRRATADEGKWAPETTALLVTQQGEHLALGAGSSPFEATTAWGALRFSLEEVAWIGPVDEAGLGQQIELLDGSRFFGFLSGPPVELPTRLFGTRAFAPSGILGLVSATTHNRPGDPGASATTPTQPYVILAGGQRLVGQPEVETLTVLTGAKEVQVPPDSVRSLRNVQDESSDADVVDADAPQFQIDLWGSGTLLGQLRDPVVPIRFRSALWVVPVADILEFHNPAPRVSDDVRLKLAGLLRDLGSDDWQVREAATQGLAGYGPLARPMLDEALKSSPDPEVRRRVEQLIGELE